MIHVNLLPSNNLVDKVKESAFTDMQVKSLDFFYDIAGGLKKRVAKLYDMGVISAEELDSALEKAVLAQARKNFVQLVEERGSFHYPDSLPMQELLAYGIQKEIFTPEELSRIPFDHEMTPESFCQSYGRKDLITYLRTVWLKTDKLKVFAGTPRHLDPHPACCH